MGMRSMYKGAISFGLVMIPMRLFAAIGADEPSFHQIHRDDGGRIRYRRVCETCGSEVGYHDIARGVDLGDGTLVPLTDDDETSLAERDTTPDRVIEVLGFIGVNEVDPMLQASHYYVEPQAAGERAYALLREALGTRKAALGKIKLTSASKTRLAVIRPHGRLLLLTTLLYADEVREATFGFLEGAEPAVSAGEKKMARQLVTAMKLSFDPAAHPDQVRAAKVALVAAKAAEQQRPSTPVAVPSRGGEQSLADALAASVKAARADAGGKAKVTA